jgi:hypothetical protein
MSHSHTFRRQSTTLPIEYHDRCRDTQRAHSNAYSATDAPRCEREGTPGPTLVRFTGLEPARSPLPRTLTLFAHLAGLHRQPGYSGKQVRKCRHNPTLGTRLNFDGLIMKWTVPVALCYQMDHLLVKQRFLDPHAPVRLQPNGPLLVRLQPNGPSG